MPAHQPEDSGLPPDLYADALAVASHDATKRQRDRVRIAKLKARLSIKDAELRGLRRKIPLTGRAALAAIRESR